MNLLAARVCELRKTLSRGIAPHFYHRSKALRMEMAQVVGHPATVLSGTSAPRTLAFYLLRRGRYESLISTSSESLALLSAAGFSFFGEVFLAALR